MKVNDVIANKGVPVFQYLHSTKNPLESIIYKPSNHLQFPYTLPKEICSNLLWNFGWSLSKTSMLKSNWSGYMQHVFSNKEENISKSHVLLPIIDLPPGDETCIYSTLLFIQSQAESLSIPTHCITFDQPLWIKVVAIIKSKSINIVCRLGGFHMLMSFMGSIGSMMKGSGLEEAMESVYGVNTVAHMISGKAVFRALRGHFLVQAALVHKLIEAVIPKTCAMSQQDNTTDEFCNTGTTPEAFTNILDAEEVKKSTNYMKWFQINN